MIQFKALSKKMIFSLFLVLLLIFCSLFAHWIVPYHPLKQDILLRFSNPSGLHWLGTDQFGRDIFSRILYGIRTSLSLSMIAVSLALLIGGSLGLFAAYYRGLLERVIMRIMDIFFAFPVILLAIGIIAILGSGLLPTAVAIAVVYTPIFARLLRGPAIVIVESGYVMFAKATGVADLRIIFRHILPNLASVVLVQTSLLLSTAILVEASLSFLGLGTQPPHSSLGTMLADGRNYLRISPWNSIFSGMAILLMAFTFNFVGDILRDQLDPRLRED